MTQTFATTTTNLYDPDGNKIAGTNDLFLNDAGNIAIAGSTQTNADQLNAVLMACATAAKAQLGEMVLQTNVGVPNFQLIWNGVPNIPQWRAALIAILRSVEGVVDVLSLTTSQATQNVLSYQAVILTQYGQGVVNA